jgi:hypothetical protein
MIFSSHGDTSASGKPQAKSPESLADFLAGQPTAPRPTLQMLRDILEKLRDIHLAGTQHFPLSPEAIRFDTAGHPIIVSGPDQRAVDQTVTFNYPKYSAPEAFAGTDHQPTSCEARDCYVLGFLFYELLIGKSLFAEQFGSVDKGPGSAWFKWHANRSVRAIPLEQLLPKIGKPTSNLIAGMIEKDAGKRIKTIQQALDQLPLEETTVLMRALGRAAPSAPAPDPAKTTRTAAPGVLIKWIEAHRKRRRSSRKKIWTAAAAAIAVAGVACVLLLKAPVPPTPSVHKPNNPPVVSAAPLPQDARTSPSPEIPTPPVALTASRIVSSVKNAKIEIDGTDLGSLPVDSPLLRPFSPGHHSLKITADHNSSLALEFKVEPGGVVALTKPLEVAALRTIVLVANPDGGRLYASPLAHASVGAEALNRVPRQGLAIPNDKLSTVSFDDDSKIAVPLGPANAAPLTIFLTENSRLVPVEIRGNLPDLTIKIDGKVLAKRAGANGSVMVRLLAGPHHIKVSHADYDDSDAQLLAVPNHPLELNVTLTLTPRTSSLQIDGVPEGVEILLDKENLRAADSSGVFKSKVNPGKHSVTFRREHFEEQSLVRDFAAGATVSIAYPSLRPFGKLTFAGSPSDADIIARDETIGNAYNCLNSQPCHLRSGTYQVTISAPGFTSSTTKLAVEPGDNKSYPFLLNSIPKQASRALITPRDLFADGQNWTVDNGGWWTHAEPGYTFLRSRRGTYIFDIQKQVGAFGNKKITFVDDFTSANHRTLYRLDNHNLHRKIYSPGVEVPVHIVAHDVPATEVFRLRIDLQPGRIIIHNEKGKLLDDLALSSFSEGRFGFSGKVTLRVYQVRSE